MNLPIDYSEIANQFPGENPYDVVAMAEILASERALHRPGDTEEESEIFAATIICIIFEPVKLQNNYVMDMKGLRNSYTGIALSMNLINGFRESFTSTLLNAENAREAISQGVNKLFKNKPDDDAQLLASHLTSGEKR